ncbi:tryptophan-rich sensory protein [Paenibacillus sp. Leaf72]|uniref:tryptophan-rich sensory protein n=1 Tax=Paenibacillus sp. Leaf72 TaxID=1736234 RepID=UPI0006FB8097|nr:tryptophan-rich sensory protein [Paenibacillus sp. Leaf72]KQO18003.1 hypothetical protein ASF12_04965 [Paenibacillus sp. Leaf72]
MNAAYRWLNAFGLLIVIVVNALAVTLPLGGKTTAQLAAQYPIQFMPAGYAFSIWSLIYLLLAGFVIYSFLPSGRASRLPSQIGILFFVSCLFNAAWIFAWQYEKVYASVFIMLALLITLIAIYTRARTPGWQTATTGERFFVELPFSLYLGWISVATIVNITSALYKSGWQGFGLSETGWTIILLAVAAMLALIIGWSYRDAAFVAVFIWAFIAIIVKQQEHDAIVFSTLAVTIVLALFIVLLLLLKLRRLHE